MGHADSKTTEIYRHYAPDRTHGADMVESAFGRGPSWGGLAGGIERATGEPKRGEAVESDFN